MAALLVMFCVVLASRDVHDAVCQDERRVQISGQAEERSYTHQSLGNYLRSVYGDTIDVYCSGPSAEELIMSMDGIKQPAKVLNATTIKLTHKKFEVERFIYGCMDMETTCRDSLTVIVIPLATVVSPNTRRKRLDETYVFVPITEDYEIVCSGSHADLLLILKDNDVYIDTEIVNNTTIKSLKMNQTESAKINYKCQSLIGPALAIQTSFELFVDYPPAATGLFCVEHDFQISCCWNVRNMETTVTLYQMNDTGSPLWVCEESSNDKDRCCVWNLSDVWKTNEEYKDELSLSVQACNLVFCANETFINIERMTILRPQPPVDLTVLSTGSHGAVVSWVHEKYSVQTLYEITYQMPEIDRRETTVMPEKTEFKETDNNFVGEVVLKLPCPAAFYEIKVYASLSTTPSTDYYISEPASVTLYTDSDSAEAVDPACREETELIDNEVIAVYEVKKLARVFRREMLALREKIRGLKQKLGKIEKMKKRMKL